MNIILQADSYKVSHYKQYPSGTEYVSSYIESRGGDFDVSVFFGLQMFLKEYLTTPITMADVDEAEEILNAHVGNFNRKDWEDIVKYHGGRLPIAIQAVPEGTVVPVGNVLVQIVNTDSRYGWLTSYVETAIHRAVWYPTTVATSSYYMKKEIYKFLEKTADDPDAEIDFKLHDFGARGVSSSESAAIGGLAHLVNFKGTDTVEALVAGRKYYNEPMAGFSIPASEHSTITAYGGPEHEIEAFENMLDQYGGEGKTFACVSDSYNIWVAVDKHWGETLKDKVINSGGTLVVRPDSGDPVDTPVKVVQRLMKKFGYYTNSKGYRVLPNSIRVIQGDGIDAVDIRRILTVMDLKGLSASSISFGMGGGLLQKVNRDTMRFAMKASAINRNGTWYDVYKDPITDKGKRSKKGVLKLTPDFQTVRDTEEGENILQTVFRNGKLMVDDTFEQVRDRAKL